MTTRRFRDNDVTTFHRRLIGMFQRVRRTQEARLARGDTAAPRRGQRQSEGGGGRKREKERERVGSIRLSGREYPREYT